MLNQEILDRYNHWYVMISGGLDSSLMLHFLLKQRTNQKVTLLTGVNKYEEVKSDQALDVCNYFNIDSLDGVEHYAFQNDHKTANEKNNNEQEFVNRLNWTEGTLGIQGRTKNPPFYIEGADERRDIVSSPVLRKEAGYPLYRPWVNIDKSVIMQMYKDEGLEDLIPLTRSCVSLYKDRCGKCFWCKEREWATKLVFNKSV